MTGIDEAARGRGGKNRLDALDVTSRSLLRHTTGTMPTSTITERTLEAQPILFVRREVAPAAIAETIRYCLGAVAKHCQQGGLQFAGPPFSRYSGIGPDRLTIECGVPVTAPADGDGEIEAGVLQAGPVAFAVHEGDYAELQHTYKAVEQWVQQNGKRAGGPPWESYVTDPEELPNPADWRTEVFWPIAD